MEKPGSPSLHSLDSVAWRTRHVTVLPDRVAPTIMVLCREFLVSYSWITLVIVSGSGCNILSLSSVNTACFICTIKSTSSSGPQFSAANFAKFRGAICEFCEILWRYYPQIPYILRPVGIVVLTDNTSKEFTLTCNTKMQTHYTGPLMMKISSWHHVNHVHNYQKKYAYNDWTLLLYKL